MNSFIIMASFYIKEILLIIHNQNAVNLQINNKMNMKQLIVY